MRQPIETAPRDGKPIRLFGPNHSDGVIGWSALMSTADSNPRVWVTPKGILGPFTEWEPIKPGEFIPFALPDEQLRALTS